MFKSYNSSRTCWKRTERRTQICNIYDWSNFFKLSYVLSGETTRNNQVNIFHFEFSISSMKTNDMNYIFWLDVKTQLVIKFQISLKDSLVNWVRLVKLFETLFYSTEYNSQYFGWQKHRELAETIRTKIESQCGYKKPAELDQKPNAMLESLLL